MPLAAGQRPRDTRAVRRWTGRLFLGLGRLLYVGPVAPTSIHAHHAFQLMRTLSGPLAVSHGPAGAEQTVTGPALAIAPDMPHATAGMTEMAVLLYVEPESRRGRALLSAIPRGTCRVAPELLALQVGDPVATSLAAAGLMDEVLAAFGAATTDAARPLRPAVRHALRLLDEGLTEPRPPAIDEVATAVGLSASRLSHLLADEVGLGFRQYILWRRLERSGRSLATGASVTEAAHAAGFADAAHMSRTFRRMFGVAPSDVAGFAEWHLGDEPS